MQAAATSGLNRKRAVWLAIVAVAVLSLVVLAYLYRRFLLSGLDLVAEATGSRKTAAVCLALAVVALLWLLVWMLFPIFVYFGLKDLRRRTAELDRTTKLCAQHLARVTADRPISNTHDLPEQRETDAESP